MRCLALELKTKDLPKLVPYCVWLMNSQLSGQTGYSPAELFLGRPSWKFDVLPELATNPTVNSWLLDQMEMQEAVIKRLETIRKKTVLRANKRSLPGNYEIGEMVLVHKQRFPQRHVPKLESPWLHLTTLTLHKSDSGYDLSPQRRHRDYPALHHNQMFRLAGA